jgi:hypothetical protein
VSPEGFEPLFFVPPRAQTNKTGTYAQQVVTRVVGYSWCLAHAWHAAREINERCDFLIYLEKWLSNLLLQNLIRRV